MVSIAHRRGAGRRDAAAVSGLAPRHDATGLHLSAGQQEYLTLHGFGPDAPRADFADPAVRTRFVQLLRECGALAPAVVAHPAARSGRHSRRAG